MYARYSSLLHYPLLFLLLLFAVSRGAIAADATDPVAACSPDNPSACEPGGGGPSNLLPAPPQPPSTLPAAPQQLHNQLGLLLVEDEVAGNRYITTLNSGGAALPGSVAGVIYGVENRIGRNQHLAAWYPHQNARDIVRFTQAEPAQAFRGLLNNSNQSVEGDILTLTPPATDYVNLLLSQQAINSLKGLSSGGSRTLSLHEELQNGGQRLLQTVVSKQASIVLRRPGQIHCRDEQVEGVQGKACRIRDVQVEGSNLHGGDIQFILRSQINAPNLRYRVGQQWHPLGVSVPVAEFNGSQGIEIFFIKPGQEQLQALQESMQGKPLNTLLEGGFYSASRHGKGDRFGLSLGGNLPADPDARQFSRMEVLLIDDQASNNQYITTLSSTGLRQQQALLYGVRHPGSGERPAVWYAGGNQASAQQALPANVTPHYTPQELFNGFASAQGQPTGDSTSSLLLGEGGWQKLLGMSAGESQQWRHEVTLASQRQMKYSHIIKGGQLQLRRPASYSCREERVENLSGVACLVREVSWQGGAISGGSDVRFSLRSSAQSPNLYYRVGKKWSRVGESVMVEEFTHSQGVEVFFVPPEAAQPAQQQLAIEPMAGMLQMQFFSASRLGQGDRFALRLDASQLQQQSGPQLRQAAAQSQLVINNLPSIVAKGLKGEMLIFPIRLNRVPNSSDALFFKLSNSRGDALEVLDLSKVQLAKSGSSSGEILNLDQNNAGVQKLGNLNSIYLELRIPISMDVSASSKMDMHINVGNSGDEGTAYKTSASIQFEYRVKELTVMSGIEVGSVLAYLYGKPMDVQGARLYYRMTPLGFTQEEIDAVRVTYKNRVGKNTQELPGELNGFFTVSQGEEWAPKFNIWVPGINANKDVRVELSTSPIFNADMTKEATVTVLSKKAASPPLTITTLSSEVVGQQGGNLIFPISFSRIPKSDEFLYFKLSNSRGEALEALDLSNARLVAADIKVNAKINLANKAGPHQLTNLQSNTLRLRIPVIKGVTEESTFTLHVNVGKQEESSSARMSTGVIKAAFQVTQLTGQSGLEQASIAGNTTQSFKQGSRLYYRITPQGFTQQENKATKISYTNSQKPNSKEYQGKLEGFIAVQLNEHWEPEFTIKVPGISADKQVKLALSTSASFAAAETKETTVTVQTKAPPPLTIDLSKDKVVGEQGDTLHFPITLSRKPGSGDSLYFKLSSSGEALKALDLTNIQLAISGASQGETVSLSNHAGAHQLTNLAGTTLELRIPVSQDVRKDSEFTLQVNVGDKEESASAKQATGSLRTIFKVTKMDATPGIESGTVFGLTEGTPWQAGGATLYYRITPQDFTDQEKAATTVSYTNMDDWSEEGQGSLMGSIAVKQNAEWSPMFTIKVPGISADKEMKVELSTSASFASAQTKEVTVTIQKRAVTRIQTLSAKEVLGKKGAMLVFDITLNQIPDKDDALYFQLTDSQGKVLERLNLHDARLIAPQIKVNEAVNLSGKAASHSLARLKSNRLRLRIPIAQEIKEESSVTLQVNTKDSKGRSSVKQVTGVIKGTAR